MRETCACLHMHLSSQIHPGYLETIQKYPFTSRSRRNFAVSSDCADHITVSHYIWPEPVGLYSGIINNQATQCLTAGEMCINTPKETLIKHKLLHAYGHINSNIASERQSEALMEGNHSTAK